MISLNQWWEATFYSSTVLKYLIQRKIILFALLHLYVTSIQYCFRFRLLTQNIIQLRNDESCLPFFFDYFYTLLQALLLKINYPPLVSIIPISVLVTHVYIIVLMFLPVSESSECFETFSTVSPLLCPAHSFIVQSLQSTSYFSCACEI